MILRNNRSANINIILSKDEPAFSLKPGLNELKKERFDDLKSNPMVSGFLNDGTLEVIEKKEDKPKGV